ncbi:MAG: GNAT family N-acetyltransferase [Anaerolineae bacterium]|nr:GNAT family N-acetyltransferase [Anaerolineae bacterium]
MIEVRTLTLDDYDAMMTVWKASGLKIRPTGRESREQMERQMSVGVQTILGAFVDGQLAGVVLATHDSRKGWINRLGVADAYKRHGVGRALVQAAEDCLHQQGITVIGALVEHQNEASRSLFESEGFEIVPTYYLSKRDRPDA